MKTEVLAPAGSKESVYAALAAGADAVYAGGRRFGARAYAENLSDSELLECIDYCHLHGKRLYLTVNTLFRDSELVELFDWLAPFYERGLDAAIVQDLGVLSFLRREFPLLDIHASTQMTVHGAGGARLLERLGATRVVPARELSLEELRDMRRQTGIEIECFVHGALCYCYSGQCLMSSLIGGRSGNRGRCAQPCRLSWTYDGGKEGFLLSPKDICALHILPDILEAGVNSLKIEGRMKKAEYAAGVSAIYRKYVDLFLQKGREYYRVEQEDIDRLSALFDRGGFSEGYYKAYNGPRMMAVKPRKRYKAPEEKLSRQSAVKEIKERYEGGRLQEKLNGKLMISPDKPVILDLILGDNRVRVTGPVAQRAKSRPISEETVRRQLCRTKDTPYLFDRLDICMGGDCFLPLQSLNELRREGIAAMERKTLRAFARETSPRSEDICAFPARGEAFRFGVSLENLDALGAVAELSGVDRIYLDSKCFCGTADKDAISRASGLCRRAGKEVWYIMPPVFRRQTAETFRMRARVWLSCFDGVLIKNLEELVFLRDVGYCGTVAADYNLYTCNREALRLLRECGVDFCACPVELNLRQLEERGLMGGELFIYGRLPLMVSAQCLQKTRGACTGVPGLHELKDRMGRVFPVRNYCPECYNVIYNCVPVSLHGMAGDVKRLKPASVRLSFTVESVRETRRITERFLDEYVFGKEAGEADYEFTRGHYKRGVE